MKTLTFVLAVASLLACGKGDNKGAGSGASGEAPPPGSGAASGAEAVQEPPPNSGFSQTITSEAVGPLKPTTNPKIVAAMFPGMDVTTKHDEGEDHSSDDTSVALHTTGAVVLHVIADNMRDSAAIFRVDVVGSMFATEAGIRVGSTVQDFVTKYPDASCRRETYTPNPEHFDKALLCETQLLPNLTFYIDPNSVTGPDGKVAIAKLAAQKFDRIIWHPKRAETGPAHVATGSNTGSAGSAAPVGPPPGAAYCFDTNADFVVDRIVATDSAATFCGTPGGALTCVSVAFDSGSFTVAQTAPTATPPVKPVTVDSEGVKKVSGTNKLVSIVDVKSGKAIQALAAGDKDYSCVESAQYLGAEILVTVSTCDKPVAHGFMFKPDGAALSKIDGINLYGVKPFRIKGGDWALHAYDTNNVMILNAPHGEGGMVEVQPPSLVKDLRIRSSIPPFVLTPKGKLVSIGINAVAVIDVMEGKPDHQYALPVCKK